MPYTACRASGVLLNEAVASGYVGILSVELHFPESGSLKGKRKFVKSAKAQLHDRYGASVAEVDHHELWQRAGLTVACAARGHRELEQLLDAVVRYLGSQEFELVRADREVVVPGE
jgi:uncharacterized protein YlxP (DUF503 family)